jgi:DNA repair exonuclease SbcCD ATPase subunit
MERMGLFGFGKKNLTAAQLEGKELEDYISSKKRELKEVEKTFKTLEKERENQSNLVDKKRNEIESFDQKLNTLKKEVIDTEDSLDMQTYGFYIPKYDFATALGYKEKLKAIRDEQKAMVRLKTAVSYSDNWTVDGSKAKGRKMTNDNIRQIVRSFNNECDAAITKVKYNNLPAAEKRIDTSFSQLNKMNASNKVGITISYLNLKKAELYLAYEYERKREDEKEALREQRQREKEEKALQKEIQSQKKIIDKDIKHYQNMIDELKQKLEKLTNEEDKKELENQIIEFYSKVSEKEEEKEELDYRTAHASAGYVYIISNIGAFGEDVFKIGVTRRLEPLERIGELSSASVPFRFDVHALIFSYEAYQLESELHEYFSSHRINKVNNRKEFFRIPIDVIEEKLKDYKDLTIDFTKTPDAEEYRESLNVNNQSI